MRKFAAPTLLALTATVAVIGVQGAPAEGLATTGRTPTHFAMTGLGFGTAGTGGQAPTASDPTAYQVIGCTNRAGIAKENHVEATTVPGLGKLENVSTKLWTTHSGDVVASHSLHSIERLTVASSSMGSLEIDGIRSTVRAFHDAQGYHGTTATHVARLLYTPTAGPAQEIPVPTPGHPATVPGLATIAVGDATKTVGNTGAHVTANALDIRVTASGGRFRVAHTGAKIDGGVTKGIFSGFASGTHGNAAAGNASIGRLPLLVMPCQGTRGDERTKSTSRSDLGNNVVANNIATRELGAQTVDAAKGYERASVASLDIGDQVVVRGIIGRANVERSHGDVIRNAAGTSIGEVTVNGETRTFPDTDVLEIPGVARLERHIVTRTTNGIQVTALRVTLLDGSGAVLEFGQARLTIRGSGL